MVMVIAANMAPIASSIQFNDLRIWGIAALCLALSITGFLMSKLAAWAARCNHEKSVTLLFSCGMRNMSVGIVVAVSFFPEAAALPAMMSILFQQSIAALMGKLSTRGVKFKG
jgi:predicted Na+-dependent transporter